MARLTRVPAKLLKRWYIFMSILASFAAVQSIAFPRWPTVRNINESLISHKLSVSDLQPVKQAILPATRSHELATSPIFVYLLGEGYQLSILNAKVRQRINLNTDFITKELPSIKLPAPNKHHKNPTSVYGHILSKPAVQTCYIKVNDNYFNDFGTESNELSELADRSVGGSAATVYQFIGLRPNRSYECILVTLISTTGNPINESKWHHILYVLSLSQH